jgi:polysaccharide deacetylase 2 family uncharacterized protein YibQ
MADRSDSAGSSGTPTKTPAQKRLDYLRRLTLLLTIIAAALAVLFILIPDPAGSGAVGTVPEGSSGSVPDFEPEYQFADDADGSAASAGAADAGASGESGSSAAGRTGPGGAALPGTGETEGAIRPAIRPLLVIVIDDVGYNLDGLKPFLDIPVPITFAVLPRLEYSKESAGLIAAAGQEIIMHLPMESLSGQYPGPGTLTESMSEQQLRDELQRNIETVPGLVGINNHMGSKGTEDIRIVREVLEFADERSLLFLDSRTTGKSVVPLMANAIEIPFIERDVFLDNQKEREYILDALQQGKAIAKQQGHAVLIGHVWTEELAQVLIDNYQFILDEGYDFATLSSVIMKGE